MRRSFQCATGLVGPTSVVGVILLLTTSLAAGTRTATFNWEDASSTVYSFFAGHGSGYESANVTSGSDINYADNEMPYSVSPFGGSHMLETTETPFGDPVGAHYSVLAYVENLSEGDIVEFSIHGYIPGGGTARIVPDAHYGQSGFGPNDDTFLGRVTFNQPNPDGEGWQEIPYDGDLNGGGPDDPIVFNSNDSFNPLLADALYLRSQGISPLAFLPKGSDDDDYNFYTDDITITVTSANADARITLPDFSTMLVNSPSCDFDGGGCGTSDVDSLVLEIAAGTDNRIFDMNGDMLVNRGDLVEWLMVAGAENLPSGRPYLVADANLDGMVDASDFEAWNRNNFSTTGLWTRGDFNADGFTDVSDFNEWNDNKFTSADLGRAVPEPSAMCLIFVGLFAILIRYGR